MLFKMAKQVDKPVFAAGLGLPMLVYYCAIGNRKLQIINQKGGPLKNIKQVLNGDHEKLKTLDSKNHVYLDELNGDYYGYDAKQKSWIPQGNVGLHYSKAEATINGDKKEHAGSNVKS